MRIRCGVIVDKKLNPGNLKGESVVVAILPSCMEVSYSRAAIKDWKTEKLKTLKIVEL